MVAAIENKKKKKKKKKSEVITAEIEKFNAVLMFHENANATFRAKLLKINYDTPTAVEKVRVPLKASHHRRDMRKEKRKSIQDGKEGGGENRATQQPPRSRVAVKVQARETAAAKARAAATAKAQEPAETQGEAAATRKTAEAKARAAVAKARTAEAPA